MNKRLSGLSCVVGASMMMLGMSSSLHATDTDEEYLLKMQQLVTSGETGIGLFPVQVPGETYAAERNQIGHRVTDFTLQGNGIASFGLVRKFQESPAGQPYAFGNMSIELPTLSFRLSEPSFRHHDSSRSINAHDMSCSHLSGVGLADDDWLGSNNASVPVKQLHNDMSFSSAGASTALLPRALVEDNVLNNYPSTALLVSKDNFYLDCDGAYYVLHAPDGTTYHFDAAASADRLPSPTSYTNPNSQVKVTTQYHTYRIRATTIKRHNSTINLTYEAMPDVDVAPPGGSVETRDARAMTPIAQTENGRSPIFNPRRLKSVTLVAAHDTNASTPSLHALDIEYNANSGNCPGLVRNIRQTYQHDGSSGVSLVHQKRYSYRTLNISESALLAAPRSGCLLSTVERADETSPSFQQFVELWNFTYGNYDGTSNGLVVTGRGAFHTENRGAWDGTVFGKHTYIPLREVLTPTGSRVGYEYNNLRPCQFTGSFDPDNPSDYDDANNCDGSTFINTVSKRTVHYQSDGQNQTQVTDFELARNSGERYLTKVTNELSRHHLFFGRSYPNNEAPNRLFSGKLLRHEYQERTGSNTFSTVVWSVFDYREDTVFAKWHQNRQWLDSSDPIVTADNPGWRYHNLRSAYRQSHRLINRYKTTTDIDGKQYIKEVSGYDNYNQPISVTETHSVPGGTTQARLTSFTYDHNYASKNGWYVALLAESKRHDGAQVQIASKTYNASGLVSSASSAGITTQYDYHLNGNVKSVTNGNGNTTQFSNYKHGVATTVASPENGLTTRVVDARGNITQENIRKEGSTYHTTNYEYNDRFSRLSKTVLPDGVDSINTSYPDWRSPSNQWRKTVTRGTQQSITHYDNLGRTDYAGAIDLNDGTQRLVNTVYDALGRVILTSDPSSSATSQTGYSFGYDVLGRMTDSKHTHDVNSTLYCYGTACATGNFNGAGTVLDGYAVRDQKGAVTAYNFRAFGSPHNAELIEIRQEIQPASGYVTNDQVVVTTLERNKAGFITKILQGPAGNPTQLSRTYVPHTMNGSLTSLIKSETHPEFGTKTVTAFDGVGNPLTVVNFDGSTHTYAYDDQERLVFHTTPASTANIQTAGTIGYTYFANGSLKTLASSGSVWTYDYNRNNLLSDATLTFDGETFDIDYHYDSELNLSQIKYPSGEVLNYTHNGFGEQLSAGAYVSNAAYHPNGYLQSMTLGSGETYSTTLNSRKRVDQINVDLAGGQGSAANPLSMAYSYTDRGNVASINSYFNSSLQQDSSLTNLQYDGLSRLHQATGDWGTGNTAANFSYDLWGNIDRRHVGGVNLNYSYNASTNKLLSASFSGSAGLNYNRVFTYDGNGNVTSDGVKNFTYDHLNRLVDADIDGTTVQANTYDGYGHRVRLIVNDGQRVRTTFFVYDPSGTLLHEFDKESGEQRDHIRFNGRAIATKARHQNYDSDSDGIPDYFERTFGLPVFNAANASQDSDGDGVTDLAEFQQGLIPTSTDSDGDGTPDGNGAPPIPPIPDPISLEPIFDYLLTN